MLLRCIREHHGQTRNQGLLRQSQSTARSASRSRWFDLLVSSDPGLNRLRAAAQSVLTIAIALGAEWAFVRLTGALQIESGATASVAMASKVATANHDLLAIAMLLGAIVGLIASVGVQDPTAKSQAITFLILPIPIISALALGIVIGHDRVAALVVIPLVLALGIYFRRFGPRGFLAGQLLFIGYFVGFSLHSVVTIGDLGWLVGRSRCRSRCGHRRAFCLVLPASGQGYRAHPAFL